jgi:predicted HAD superfamily Cof-like phosphohydrolase
MSIFKDQADFMALANQDLNVGRSKQADMYVTLIAEESFEFAETQYADYVGHITDDIKEALDVIVVAAGYLNTILGPDKAQAAWNLVHETNLAKLKGTVEKREDGKVVMSKEWKEAMKKKLKEDLMTLEAK